MNNKNHRLLVIDIQNSFDELRPAIQELYYKELSNLGNEVYLLLRRNIFSEQILSQGSDKIYYRPIVKLYKYRIDIFLIYFIFQIWRKHRIDTIFVRNDILSGIQGLIASRIFKTLFVFIKAFPSEEFAILYLEVGLKKAKFLRKPFYKMKQKLSELVMKKADLIIPKSDAYKDYLSNLGIRKTKMLTIPMGFDCRIQPKEESINILKKKLNLTDEKIIIYVGDMGPTRNLEFAIDVIDSLINKRYRVKLLMVGGSSKELKRLRNYAGEKNITDHITFVGWINRSEVYSYLAISNISISPIPPIDVYLISSPTKTVESLGLAIPIVANEEIHDQKRVIEESEGGICVPYSPEAFSDAISLLLEDPKLAQKLGENGRGYVKKYRDWRILARKVHQALIMLHEKREMDNA